MTETPTVERIETTKCSECFRNCAQLCTRCEKKFCGKHLLEHAEKCSVYKTIIHKILQNDLNEIVKQVVEEIIRSI